MLRLLLQNIALRYNVLTAIYNGFINLEIEKDSKVIIDYYNKNNSPNSIILQIEDIRRLSQDLNIYKCDFICKIQSFFS